MSKKTTYVWFNGELKDQQDAQLPFLTAGLHYGIGVFEGIRCYQTDDGPAVFRLRDHINRLALSASVLGWKSLPFTR
jgi:branched-chain amino acid aminotransferase